MPIPAIESSFKDIPEFYERNLGESLIARTESLRSFRELGAPDLCHIVKINTKSLKEVSSYHFVLGPDTSSTASLAAYLNTLVYKVGINKNNHWKIKSAVYCTYNAFSKIDIRVTMQIPGGVEAYIVDPKGEKYPIKEDNIWKETFICSVLRAIHDDNDRPNGNNGRPLLGLKKYDPLPNLQLERKFLDAATDEFWRGWELGTSFDIQSATHSFNHLSLGIYNYFKNSERLDEAAKFFAPLYEVNKEVSGIYCKCLIGSDNEILAVREMYNTLKYLPYDYGTLLNQIDLLIGKNKLLEASKLAKIAVVHSSSEFKVWSKLTEVYIKMGDFEAALLALNACPMYTFIENDSHSMPIPLRVHRPLKPDMNSSYYTGEFKNISVFNGSLMEENNPKENEVHPELQQQPALNLRGTFNLAYNLLIEIYKVIGWDSLLKFRSTVFVMEEEYKIFRSMNNEKKNKLIKDKHDNNEDEEEELSNELKNVNLNNKLYSSDDSNLNNIQEPNSLETNNNNYDNDNDNEYEENYSNKEEENLEDNTTTTTNNNNDNSIISKTSETIAFKNKRLCEKWLDNLFMVLYSDVRLYTLLKQEIGKPVSTNGYRKSGAEWEMIGDLCNRLGNTNDAIICYNTSLNQRINLKSYLMLLLIYKDYDLNNSLLIISKLLPLFDRIFINTIYPNLISESLLKLISNYGLAKIQNSLISLHIPVNEFKLITKYLEYTETFSCKGYDW